MSLKRTLILFVCLVSMAVVPSSAYASCPVQSDVVALGYEQTYIRQGSTYTHHGVDVACAAFSDIVAPCAGTVAFVGSVPASDTSEGETMLAVSFDIGAGRTVTLMPCQELFVSEGQQVEEGELLASLAAGGDASSSQTHLHLGLKRGNVYEDPSWLLGLATSTVEQSVAQEQEEASAAVDGGNAELQDTVAEQDKAAYDLAQGVQVQSQAAETLEPSLDEASLSASTITSGESAESLASQYGDLVYGLNEGQGNVQEGESALASAASAAQALAQEIMEVLARLPLWAYVATGTAAAFTAVAVSKRRAMWLALQKHVQKQWGKTPVAGGELVRSKARC